VFAARIIFSTWTPGSVTRDSRAPMARLAMAAATVHQPTLGAQIFPGTETKSWGDVVSLFGAYLRRGLLKRAAGKVSDPSARSSKRTVRLISEVALDECLDPERYRARVPFQSVVEGVRIDEELARKASVVHTIASANLAPSARDDYASLK
jgi:hypothetical protein